MTRRTKQQQLEAHLEAIQRLRKEIAEEDRRAKRRQDAVLAKGVAELGLMETVLALPQQERQRIGRLGSPAERCVELVRFCEQEIASGEEAKMASARG